MCWCVSVKTALYGLQNCTRLLLVAVLVANVISKGWSQQQELPITPVTDYVNLPPEYSRSVPERLCFTATDLALCVSDPYARNCILKDSVVLDPNSWPQSFRNGIPVLRPEQRNLTISSDACSTGGACRPQAGTTDLQSLNFNFVPGLVLVNPGASLTLSYVTFTNLANASTYTYSQQQPYRAVGRGSAIWPSFVLAPNATLSLVNSSLPYMSPSADDNCSTVTEKAWFSIRQIWDNNTQLDNATSIRVLGPVIIPLMIVNASTNATLGNATVIVANLSLVCMANTTGIVPDSGDKTRTLAIAIAVPIGTVLLLGGLLAFFCLKRRRQQQQHRHKQAALADKPSVQSCGKDSPTLVSDIENDTAPCKAGWDQDKPSAAPRKDTASQTAAAPLLQHSCRLHPTQGIMPQPAPAADTNGLQPDAPTHPQRSGLSLEGPDTPFSVPVAAAGPSRQGSVDAVQAAQLARHSHTGLPPTASVPPVYGASSSSIKGRSGVRQSRSFRGSVGLGVGAGGDSRGTQEGGPTGSGRAAQPAAAGSSHVNGHSSRQHASGQVQPPIAVPRQYAGKDSGGVSASGGTQCSSGAHSSGGGGHDSGCPGDGSKAATSTKYDLSILKSSSRSTRYGIGSNKSSRINDRLDSLSNLLKARSDVAVLRDLRIGPLLGRGSYGRVYKGRWKATSVAVKVIEHRAGNSSKGVSAGREELLATTSHPNVVKCYHISTMTSSQRAAMAVSWMEGSPSTEATAPSQQQPESKQAGSAHSSNSDDPESPPEMLETWIIMEFCEKGSLARAIKLGKFNRGTADGVGLVGIYKALLDTASGLDYLHSIGVVHGDLKTANVLLKGSTRDARGVTCKITDFGLSRVLDMDASHINTGTYGTVAYMPKELLLSGRMTQATDIYSFGLMMWELFTAVQVMNEGLSIGQMFYMIAYQDWRPDVPADCPPEFVDLMTACWHEDPLQRPNAQQLLSTLQKLYIESRQQHAAAKAAGGVPGKSGPGMTEAELLDS